MRSVVVVLPASMCAAMPMFLVYLRSTSCAINVYAAGCAQHAVPGTPTARLPCPKPVPLLPAIVRECFVGLRHLVGVFPLLYRRADALSGIHELRRQLVHH